MLWARPAITYLGAMTLRSWRVVRNNPHTLMWNLTGEMDPRWVTYKQAQASMGP